MEEDRDLVRPWIPYISLLLDCLKEIPPSDYILLYRGLRMPISELKGSFNVGDQVQAIFSVILSFSVLR
jgi:hypothetical protein